jgi:helicase SWR1
MGTMLEDETMQRVGKLHTVLRPYLLRRLKKDVEKELPSKYEHLVLCHLSKRQRFLYDEFMSRGQTRDALQSGIYQRIANILMQLRKVCNHPDLFEVRPIATSFAMDRSAIADFEIKELLIRRRLLNSEDSPGLDVLGLQFIDRQNTSVIAALESRRLDATPQFPLTSDLPGEAPPHDTRTISGFRAYADYQRGLEIKARWSHMAYINRRRCNRIPVYSKEMIMTSEKFYTSTTRRHDDTPHALVAALTSFPTRAQEMKDIIEKFTFVTPSVVALDMPRFALTGSHGLVKSIAFDVSFDEILHHAIVKQRVVFPDPSLLQYDCGKLQELNRLLREKKRGGHRVLIFTQMTRILDILEIFLNFHGYLYLRLDGATKIEDRQYITERFNADARIFCFIASSRSGGVGIK